MASGLLVSGAEIFGKGIEAAWATFAGVYDWVLAIWEHVGEYLPDFRWAKLFVFSVYLKGILAGLALYMSHRISSNMVRSALDINGRLTCVGDLFRWEMGPHGLVFDLVYLIPLAGQVVAVVIFAVIVAFAALSWCYYGVALYRKESLRGYKTKEVAKLGKGEGAQPLNEAAVQGSPIRYLTDFPKILVEFKVGDHTTLGFGTVIKHRGNFYIVTASHVLAVWNKAGEDAHMVGPKGKLSRSKCVSQMHAVICSPSRQLDVTVLKMSDSIRQHLGVRPAKIAGRIYPDQDVEVVGRTIEDGRPAFSNGRLGPCYELPYQVVHYSSTLPGWSGAPVLTRNANVLGIHLGATTSRKSNRMLILPDLFSTFLEMDESDTRDRDYWKSYFEREELRASDYEASYEIGAEYGDYLVYKRGASDLAIVSREQRGGSSSSNPRWADMVDDDDDYYNVIQESLNSASSSQAGAMSLLRVTKPATPLTSRADELGKLVSALVKTQCQKDPEIQPESIRYTKPVPKPESLDGRNVVVRENGEASCTKQVAFELASKSTSRASSKRKAKNSPDSFANGTLPGSNPQPSGQIGSTGTIVDYDLELSNVLAKKLSPHLPPDFPTLLSDITRMIKSLQINKRKLWLSCLTGSTGFERQPTSSS